MAVYITNKVKVKLLGRGVYRMTLDYGNTYSDGSFHSGIDLTGNPNVDDGYDAVLAFADGVVVNCCNTASGTTNATDVRGMGNYVILDHGNGYRTRYLHMTKGSVKVTKGQTVKAGQVLGRMGSTGRSTGRHLHFDIALNKKYLDPKPFLYGQVKINVAITPAATATKYTTGTYVILKDLNVREGPGTNYGIKYYSKFTVNARSQVKKYAGEAVNYFPAGVRITISEVKGTWGKCPSGWISLNYCKKVG